MPYSESVLARATLRLEARRRDRETRQQARREEIYRALPRMAEIDRRLRQTGPRIIAAAFQRGEDPGEMVSSLRQENLALQRERAALLAEQGYPPDALEGTPFCPLCGDTGWRGAAMCSCLKQLCAEEQIKELSSLLDLGEQSFEKFQLEYYDNTPWPDYGRSPRKNMEVVLRICQDYAADFGSYFRKNLFLWGGTGLGKTFLSSCMARTVSEKGFSVVYDTAGNIFSRFEEQKFSRDTEDVQQARDLTRKYLRCDLLILDDLGSELTTPFVQTALYTLINSRLTAGLSTVISTNLTIKDVRLRYTPQITSRLEGEYQSLPFFGRDIRLIKKLERK